MRHLLRWVVLLACAFYLVVAASLLYLRFLPPLITPVQIQRQIEATAEGADLARRYQFVGLGRISDHLEHAVVAAEDARFYQHNGFDWTEVRAARRDAQRSGRPLRGASTLTQQLVKNLFLTTHRSPVRKVLEWSITPLAEGILGKRRILELYLNVAEWGRGVYGAEAAAQRYYNTSAASLSRDQAARLAALLPAPRTRMPGRMDNYSASIKARMRQMGW